MSTLLVADIGGTKIDFALVDSSTAGFAPLHQGKLQSAGFCTCAEVIAACLDSFEGSVDFASLAVAGPVVDQQVSFTNLPWQTGAAALAEEFGFKGVVLSNDLVALAEGVALLGKDDVVTIKQGRATGRAGHLVVAPGTGLGGAYACGSDPHSSVQATEMGHLSFAPRTETEMQLLAFLQQEHDHVSFEMVCSGMGLGNIFSFLQSSGLPVPEEVAEESRQGHDLAPLLAARALAADIDCPISTRTYALFIDVLAEFCGNMALALLPGAPLYLGGGMLPRLGALCDWQRFVSRFEDRGKMRELVGAGPVYLITHPHPALLGACRVGRRIFYDEK